MRKYNFVILCFLMLKQPLVFGQDSGIIYGHNHAYTLTSPKGWVLDNSSGVSQGLHAVFYPVGSSWAGAVTVMYTSVAYRDSSKNEKIEGVMKHDIDKFKQNSPNLRVEEKESIEVDNGNKRQGLFIFLLTDSVAMKLSPIYRKIKLLL